MRKSPCKNCGKYDCQRMCDNWIAWFVASWDEIRQAGRQKGGNL